MPGRGVGRSLLALTLLLGSPGVARATCEDGVQDGPETDVDCGGDCRPCDHGDTCLSARDCASGRCAAHVCEERPYIEGDPVPPGYEVVASETDSSATVRKLGLILWGASYGVAWVSAVSLPGELSVLYVPVIGPWLAVADSGTPVPGLIAIDGALQTVGASLFIGGLLTGGDQLLRVREAPKPPPVQISAGPTRDGGYRVGVYGTF